MRWAYFERNIIKKIPTPLFEDPVKFIVPWAYFERLQYNYM